jgi:hypothetical protein
MSFSSKPKTPYDFMSMTYDVPKRSATVLVRQSYYPRRQRHEDLDEYDHRMEACRSQWAHPFITPVVLLQVQFSRTEEAVIVNNQNVKNVEYEVGSMVGFEGFEAEREKRAKLNQRSSFWKGTSEDDIVGPMNSTALMKGAHEVLKESIKLLDTIRWMERAVKLLIQAGDELAGINGGEVADLFGIPSLAMFDSNVPAFPPLDRKFPPNVSGARDPMQGHWHDIRQYLDGLLRLCLSLETDRRMSEARCRAQIDIVSGYEFGNAAYLTDIDLQ